jgi:hypothetical protein
MSPKPFVSHTIAVDFDHTLIDFDKPLPGAKEAMQKLHELGYHIMIYSCNGYEWIQKVLNTHEIYYDTIYDNASGNGKPAVFAYVDDRGIGFNGDWTQAVEEIENLEKRRAKIKELV